MDTIFYNGVIRTLDQAYPQVSAMAIKDGVILRLGSDEEILALKKPETRLVDLKGRLMLPGFADTHLHLLFYGTFRRRELLGGVSGLSARIGEAGRDAGSPRLARKLPRGHRQKLL